MSLPVVVFCVKTGELALDSVTWHRVEEYIPLKRRRQMEAERRDYLRRKLQVGDEACFFACSYMRAAARL